jgi:predicted TIM-barrel fold metal-dependent hydrolase
VDLQSDEDEHWENFEIYKPPLKVANMTLKIMAIDAVVNIWTKEALANRPERKSFYVDKMRVGKGSFDGVSLEEMIGRMDAAGIERSFLIAAKVGVKHHPACYQVPYALVADAVQKYPERFSGLAGIDPTEGMAGVRELERSVREYGFIGAHSYPHWFELAPDHAKYYPFYAKCVELNIPIQLQVGQSMVYDSSYPRRSVGRPISLDSVACDFPELKLVGIHVGIPWTDEMIAMAWKHSNVYIGCDAHRPTYWPESFVKYINSFGQDKVIFGTDFPVLPFEQTRSDIEALGLKPEVMRKLMRDNAVRVYKLE